MDPRSKHSIRVWDLPTRLFHWCLAAAVVALIGTAWLGGEWMTWHFRLGHAVLALLLFRLVWGFVGGHWSRFSRFLPSPGRAIGYLRGQTSVSATPGHNPLGALSVYAMLLALIVQVVSGLLSDDEIASTGPLAAFAPAAWVSRATRYHKDIGQWLVIALLVVHVLAVLYYLLVRRRRLVGAMVHGDLAVEDASRYQASRDDMPRRLLALAVLLACAAFARWVYGLGG